MKRKLIILLLIFYYPQIIEAQVQITTSLTRNGVWNDFKKDYDIMEENSFVTTFDINADWSLIKHTTPQMTVSTG